MRNALTLSTDGRSLVLVDSRQEDNRLNISSRGLTLSLVANEIVGAEVPPELETYLDSLLRGRQPFYEFPLDDAARNQLCFAYNDNSNVLYVIGITDIDISMPTGPNDVGSDKVRTIAVKFKPSTGHGLTSNRMVLARMELQADSSAKDMRASIKEKKIALYFIEEPFVRNRS